MARCTCQDASAGTCEAIVQCVAANLGPGMRYDTVTGQLAARLSSTSPNAFTFGDDGGLLIPGEPDPADGIHTVAELPQRAITANLGGGGGMVPFGSPQGLEYGIANRIDIISLHTFALADGTIISRPTSPTTAASTISDNPGPLQMRYLTALELAFLSIDAGARTTPTGRSSGAPSALLSPDGGWFGFYAPHYPIMTMEEALWRIAGRAVATVANFGGIDAAAVARGHFGAIDAIVSARAQAWSIMFATAVIGASGTPRPHAPVAQWVDSILSAGITAGVDYFDYGIADPSVRLTGAQIAATGATWVRVQTPDRALGVPNNSIAPAAVIDDFINAGLNVMAVTSGRQYWSDHWFGRGVRAIQTDTPVYTRGGRGFTGDLDYRHDTIPGLETRTTFEGALTFLTDNGIGTPSDHGYARQSTPGRYFRQRYAWQDGIGPRLNAQLLGPLCPLPRTSNYRLRLRCRVDPAQTTVPAGVVPKIGWFLCVPDDRSITFFDPVNPGNPPPPEGAHVNGYALFVRVGSVRPGEFVITQFTNGNVLLVEQEQAFPSISYGDWINWDIEVTDSSLSVTLQHTTGPSQTYTTNNDLHRGPYAFYLWEDAIETPASNQGFFHGYSSRPDVISMYEEL